MAIKLRVPDADRERLGLPEWIEYDPEYLLLSDAVVLQEELGIDPWDLAGELAAKPVLDASGAPVMNGDKPRKVHNWNAWKFAVWIAAKHAGCAVPFGAFDINVIGLSTGRPEPDDEVADDPKDPSTPESVSDDSASPSEH